MADSKLRDLSTDFAVKVIKMCDSIKGHYSLVNQLERSLPPSVQIFTRRTMRIVKPTLLQSFKLR